MKQPSFSRLDSAWFAFLIVIVVALAGATVGNERPGKETCLDPAAIPAKDVQHREEAAVVFERTGEMPHGPEPCASAISGTSASPRRARIPPSSAALHSQTFNLQALDFKTSP
jgi:hypothetical protein